MKINHGLILCCSYIFGLFLTCVWGGINTHPTRLQWMMASGIIVLIMGIALGLSRRYFWQLKFSLIIATGLVMLLALGYCQWRIPQLQTDSIFQVTKTESNLIGKPIVLYGEVLSQPHTKGINKSSFWLTAKKIILDEQNIEVKSKLYVTYKSSEQSINQGDTVLLKGKLYQPPTTNISWLFDFAKFLQTKNTFWGFVSEELMSRRSTTSWLFKIRLRITRIHHDALGSEKGALLSAMILGRQAVDLPEHIYELWKQVGLAYTIAASGFHVSLLLGITQWFMKSKPEKIQFAIGISVLSFYVLLTGFSPSILRAAVMGSVGLLAIALDRKIKPLGLLIFTATTLLVINPLWIWDLGFQLSFLATFGLFTTLEPIKKKLDFVPPTIATAIAIPIAASLWTMPVLAYQFNVVVLYSIPLSIVLSLPIFFISLVGMASAVVGLLVPTFGLLIAVLLELPISIMFGIVNEVSQLPLSNVSIGALHWSHLILIYGAMIVIWLTPWGKRHVQTLIWGLFSFFLIILIAKNYNTTRLMIWNIDGIPTLLAQAAGKTLVIQPTLDDNIKYTLYPLLRREGINKIHAVINPFPRNPLDINSQLYTDFSVEEQFITDSSPDLSLSTMQLQEVRKRFGHMHIEILSNKPSILDIKIRDEHFYLFGDRQSDSSSIPSLSQGYLITSAANLKDYQLLATIKPKQAIAIGSRKGHPLAANAIILWAEEDTIWQWTPNHDFVSVSSQ